MRLEKIKLAGFKSFVDPTVVPLPGNLVGIVGPNGCGKSNIIDAVRWVMGESSAKHLRGGTMADVIFNGSSSRKPVGMAHVELIFDNSEGKAPGEFAKYREISIKRQVGRDGQSVYLLNGSRCRRKDITDLFLGTGLGARSYAIIEQGTISRLIEAKPDELRAVIEEAAGISKYKDRRHETGLRMEHTSDNLARLQDLRDEVGKQLASLQRQAKKAEKFTALKEEELRYKSQLLAIRWRKYDQLLDRHRLSLAELETAYRQTVGEDNGLVVSAQNTQKQLEILREQLNETQARFYELSLNISRLEQIIEQSRKSREQLQQERIRMEEEQQEAQSDLEQDRHTLLAIREEKAELALQLEKKLEQDSQLAGQRDTAAQTLEQMRLGLESLDRETAQSRNEINIQQTRLKQMEQQHRQLEARRERLETERDELEDSADRGDIPNMEREVAELNAERTEIQQILSGLSERVQEERNRVRHCQTELNIQRAEQHGIKGTISSLETLQRQAMGKDKAGLGTWLENQGLDRVTRLAEHLEVEPGWEVAVETVLGHHLEALCVEDATHFLTETSAPISESLAFFETTRRSRALSKPVATGDRKLSERINFPWELDSLLGSVYCADDLVMARNLSGRLDSHESAVTPDGWRVGSNWVALPKSDDGKAGILQRERELRDLKAREEQGKIQSRQLESQLDTAESAIQHAEQERRQLEAQERQLASEQSRLSAELSAAKARHEQAQKRLSQLDYEWNDLEENRIVLAEQMAEAEIMMATAENRLDALEPKTREGAALRQQAEVRLNEAEAELKQRREQILETRSRLENLSVTETLTLKHLERAESQFNHAAERLDTVTFRITESEVPLEDEQAELTGLREERSETEQILERQRKQVRDVETELRQLSEQRLSKERELAEIRQQLDQIKLELQANEVRRQTVQEQFDELSLTPDVVMLTLPEEAEEKAWQQRSTQLGEEIAQLGAVNLAAMEEFMEQSERMEFLEKQHQDLTESLDTLKRAIEKIDQECRSRFRETFDKVNAGLQRMFPKLFGGGQAYLELMERELLESGVSVIARPPGKRNSSIHLLSGGEKALTAVALVFAIFELNPAPFCLLDEVDAPLDDANVGRFSQLVKEMSEKVQFLFISHNKVTMEIAQHLAGVTMKEPGVSRIVAVDIAEAVELAAA